jgi:cytosine/adenosine deaminase-related metal-dependent hydrolase
VDLILVNGRVTTLDRQNPQAHAIAIRGDRFVAVGTEQDIMRLAGSGTRRIDLKGRRVIPGLIDSYMATRLDARRDLRRHDGAREDLWRRLWARAHLRQGDVGSRERGRRLNTGNWRFHARVD